MKKIYLLLLTMLFTASTFAQTIASQEVEPNGTVATASPIVGTSAKIKGNIFVNGDLDFYSFTAAAGDKLYAAIQTSFSSSASTDAQLRLFASDGTTLIEFDEDDGTFGGLSSTIAGATIPAAGTYYLQVKHFSATSQLRGYDLYFRLQSGTPTSEVESNDTPASANTMPANGWVSGARSPALATEQDWFSVTLAAGETVFLSMDLDPERDNVQYNGRLGFALFGDASNQILVVDDASAGSVANPLSEAFFFTAKNAGTYYVFADAAVATTGGPTATYNISFTKFARTSVYTNYPSADIPKTIGPGAASVISTINIPDSKLISDISIRVDLSHTVMGQVDAVLTSPNGNTIHLFTDIGAAATGGQTQMDAVFNDNNSIPPAFTVLRPVGYQPELNCKLDMLKGMNSQGVWTLTLYDDVADANGGTLNNWSIDVLEFVPPSIAGLTVIVNENFEATDGGFTHSGTADEWEYGTPATIATTTTSPVAGFTTANSGTKCWKTDLDNTYDFSSVQTLESPTYNLTTFTGPIWLSWAMKHQLESASFDTLRVFVEEIGGTALVQTYFQWLGATTTAAVGSPTVNIGLAAGWGTHWVDLSAFAGKQIRFKVRMGSDNSINYGGVAIDDVRIYATPSCTPSSITLGTSPTVCSGITSANLPYTATTGTPDRYNIDYDAAAEAQGFVDVVNAVLPATPIALTVPGGAIPATYNGSITVQLAAGGCLSPAVAFTVTINPTPNALATPSTQTVCSGSPITTIVISGTGTTYNWTRDNTVAVTGIANSGAGDISGTLTNTTTAPVTVTFTITPTANGCPGAAITATVLVNPTPTAIATPSSQTVCSGLAITTIAITGNPVAGVVYNWTRDNTVAVTGISASGAGDISGTLTNTTTAPVTVTFTITPTANGCPGAAITATVLVNPTPTAVATPSSQTVCSGIAITTIAITGNAVAGVVYNWTRDNTASVTGIAASSAGDISGTLTNTTASPVTVTFTIIPTANGCPGAAITATVLVNPLPIIGSTQVEPTTCASADGSITLTLSGAAGPYTFAWTGSGVNPTSQNQTGLTVGAYSVTVTAANGCTAIANIGLIGAGGCGICPTIPTFTTTPSGAACSGSNVTLTASGLTSMGSTYGILFKYSTTALADPYVGGTTIATIANGALTSGGTVATANTTTIPVGNYFVYAILTPTPVDPACRPAATVNLTIATTPDVNAVANQVVCNGASTAAVNFTGAVAGTVYNWTNNDPSIGLAASGSGNIGAFTAVNTGTTPVVATVTVTPSTTSGGGGGPVTQTFNFTGGMQTFTVPAGVTSIFLQNWGAQGGSGALGGASVSGGSGGLGGYAEGNLAVTPGQVLNIFVGGQGAAPAAGFNGGANGGSQNAGGGGGASDVRVGGTGAANRVITAGGGGGGGRGGCDEGSAATGGIGGNGGSGGGGVGQNGNNSPTSGGVAGGGFGGNGGSIQGAFGAAGIGCAGFLGQPGITAATEVGGVGGGGQSCCCSSQPTIVGGGGGGGGQIGGGGAGGGSAGTVSCSGNSKGAGGGGGGGSSFIGGVTSGVTNNGIWLGNGQITISYSAAAPITCTGTPITYTYTVNPTPDVNAVTNQVVCNGASTAAVNFTGAVAGTVFNWTNNDPSIGLAASGTGNIGSFTATNAGTSPVVATVTVTPSTTSGGGGGPVTQTFNFTGGMQTFTVPAGVTSIFLQNWGAQGGSGALGGASVSGGSGGLGGYAEGNLAVTPGQVLNIFVGGQGAVPSAGFNGGGTGGNQNSGGGGGASDIRVGGTAAANRVITAGGGGGGGRGGCDEGSAATGGIGGNGGSGGGGIGQNGNDSPTSGGLAGGGFGGNMSSIQGAFGTKGIGCASFSGQDGIAAASETGGTGGAGQNCCCSSQNSIPGGGGGGGGQIGGGGAGGGSAGTVGCTGNSKGAGGGGGGGSSFIGGVTSGVINNGIWLGNGQITLSYSVAAPITCTGTPITYTYTVNPTPTAVATPAAQTICNAVAITPIVLTGAVSGTTYAWTRDNTATVTGIAASGSGNITGTLTNTTTAPVTVTFTITPTANGCPGAAITATVIVNPTPVVNAVPNQVVCNGVLTTPVTFTTPNTGTTITYNWVNNTPSIGLAASGSGNIGAFTAVNTGTTPVVATVTVTPTIGVVGGPVTQNFNFTGGMQTFTVPAGVTSINIAAFGAQGGSGALGGNSVSGGTGGLGASTSGTLAVTPGQVLNIFVGGAGGTPTIGFNGGGTGGTLNAGGGGGASDVRVGGTAAANRVITAGGGGGGGRGGCHESSASGGIGGNGGEGGGGIGQNGNNSAQSSGVAGGGQGGNFGSIQGGLGSAGIGCSGFLGQPGLSTATENGGNGGSGQTCCCSLSNSQPGGGGGGGGQVGGGGAGGGSAGTTGCSGNSKGAGGGGGGGSSFIGGVTAGIMTAGIQTGNGLVTITYNAASPCLGTPITYTYTVNPTPTAVATPAAQTICSGTAIAPIVLTGAVAGTTYAWTRDNTVAVTGIAASGSGNISGTLTNTTPLPVTVTFTIIPTANGCPGLPITATVLVNPRPVMTALPAAQTICNGVTITPIVFASTTPGTTYTWTRDNSGSTTAPGGIQASGSGPSITGFMINTTNAPITVTFTITPTFAGCVGITPVTATVTIQPTTTAVATPATQLSCSGQPITTINLTSPVAGTVYNWTRDNVVAATGIAASGTGNISGTLTTTGTTPVVVTFTITPSINGCLGVPIIAVDTINPTPTVTQPGNQVLCNGSTTTAVAFTGAVPGTVFNWTNNTPSIGLAATGTGNIPVFTAVNTTNAPVTATITVTPVVTSTGCVGVARTFTITVNPTANVGVVPNQTLCTGSSTAAITFTGTVAGTTFSWTNNTPSIGLAASGTGNIPSFTAINTTPTAVTATITVTPNTAAGCVGVATTFTITVNGNSVAPTGAAASVTTSCGPTSTTLSVVGGALGTGASWRWYSGSCGGVLVGTGASITIPVNTTTTYFVRAEGTCNTTLCSPGVTVTINTVPTISIAAAPYTALTPLLRTNLTATVSPTAVGNVVEWYYENGPTSIATGLSINNITVDQVGSYRAKITTAQGCTATSNTVEIRDSATGQLFVYPNPNRGQFQIRYYLPENSISVVRKVAIFDSKGALVYNQRLSVQTRWGAMNINLNVAQGGYFIKILDVNENEIIGARVQVLR